MTENNSAFSALPENYMDDISFEDLEKAYLEQCELVSELNRICVLLIAALGQCFAKSADSKEVKRIASEAVIEVLVESIRNLEPGNKT